MQWSISYSAKIALFLFIILYFGINLSSYAAVQTSDRFPPFVDCNDNLSIEKNDCLALVEFHKATAGPAWGYSDYWLTTVDPCGGPIWTAWRGVVCDNGESGKRRVIKLTFLFKNLAAVQFPSNALAKLPLLAELRLQSESSTAIPSSLGGITNLKTLHLSSGKFAGEIPASLGELTKLHTLTLGGNQLDGSLPASFGQLRQLKVLLLPGKGGLEGNLFTGNIPDTWGGMVSLEQLYLPNNKLSGRLPAALGQLSKLRVLDVSGNHSLNHALPMSLTDLSNLDEFRYDNTALCAPDDAKYEAWERQIPHVRPSGLTCSAEPVVDIRKNYGLSDDCTAPMVTVGNPINIGTGNKVQVEEDYRGAGAFPLVFRRYYNGTDGVWRGDYSQSLELQSSQGFVFTVIAERADGKQIRFRRKEQGWVSDADVVMRLQTVEQSGVLQGWRVQTADDTVEHYNMEGRLQSITQRGGLKQTLEYNDDELASVTDDFGRRLEFQWHDKRLVVLRDPAGAEIRYDYTGLQISAVHYPTLPGTPDTPRRYLYQDSRWRWLLTGITDELGQPYARWTYDAQGRAVTSEHAGGVERTQITYAERGPTLVTNAVGKTAKYFTRLSHGVLKIDHVDGEASEHCEAATRAYRYDPQGFVAERVDWNGQKTQYAYNDRGLETSRTEAVGTPEERVVNINWHESFRVPKSLSGVPVTQQFDYDAQGRLLRHSEGDIAQTRYSYNAQGLMESMDGPREDIQDITRYRYDAQGNVREIVRPLNQRWQFDQYDAHGRPGRQIDPNGLVTEYLYHPRGWLLQQRIKSSQGDIDTRFGYDAAGQLINLSLPGGEKVVFSYDPAHRLREIRRGDGSRIDYTLNPLSQIVKTEIYDAHGALAQRSEGKFDELGRLRELLDAHQNRLFAYRYDPNGLLLTEQDGEGHVTERQYDGLHRLTQLKDALARASYYSHNPQDQLTNVKDPLGLTTQYQHTSLNQLESETSKARGEMFWSYDEAKNPIEQEDARGVLVTRTFDALNRLTQEEASVDRKHHANASIDQESALNESFEKDSARANDVIRYEYDQGTSALGRLTAVHGPQGVMRYRYDDQGHVIDTTWEINAQRHSITYQLDLLGRPVMLQYPSGRRVQMQRDMLGHVAQVKTQIREGAAWQVVAQDIRYQPWGAWSSWRDGHGGEVLRQYDLNGRLVDLKVTRAGQTLLARTLSYTPVQQLARIQDSLNPIQSMNYRYDAVGQLTGAQQEAGSYYQFQYDGLGRRLETSVIPSQTSPDQENDGATSSEQYRYVVGRPWLQAIERTSNTSTEVSTYTHDAIGNIVKMQQGSDIWRTTYDKFNRPSKVSRNSALVASYGYNAQGQRVIKTLANGQSIYYHYDLNGRLLAEHDNTGKVIREYIYLEDTPLALVTGDKIYFYQTDHLDTPQSLADEKGKIVWQARYSPFGMAELITAEVEQPLRFPGQYADTETGLYYNHHRYYDPRIGRYTQSDPIGLAGGLNTYSYANNNPVAFIDPDGLEAGIHYRLRVMELGYLSGVVSQTRYQQALVAEGEGALTGLAIVAPWEGLALKFGLRMCGGVANKGLGPNLFKGKSFDEIDKLLTERGFKKIGTDPAGGKGSYFHPESGRKYYLDKGGNYREGAELPHVDVHRMRNGVNLEKEGKRRYPLSDNLIEPKP